MTNGSPLKRGVHTDEGTKEENLLTDSVNGLATCCCNAWDYLFDGDTPSWYVCVSMATSGYEIVQDKPSEVVEWGLR